MGRLRSAGAGRSVPPAEPSDDLDDRRADPDADPEEVARTICLRLLTTRARSRAELAEALTARSVPASAATAVLDRLAAVGLVDDHAFAGQYARSRQQDRGLAVREISRQLRDKGIDEEAITAAVADIAGDAEAEAARQLVARKLRSMARLTPEVKTRRLVGMLARKGYPPSLAFSIVQQAVGRASDEAVDDETAWLA
ncbi:regulatory protein RecX [Jatrophihabitans sp.]|uniref:regulatory protein RecX n=1 Tax=Jatrophihabitans sp. TaxID=1932789 RepID=UPI002CAC57CB|nr:regulatory protein RecX [Jatrophihabitans sp.]